MSISFLDPKQPLDIEPAADRNVERMSSCCLDVNAKGAYIVKGRNGGAWWMIWIAMMCIVLGVPMCFFDGDLGQGLPAYLGVVTITIAIFGPSLYIWPIRVWRTHLPLRFNRRTRKVYLHWKGKTYIEDWDTIRVYLEVQAGMTGVGAPIRDPHVNVEFRDEHGNAFVMMLMGTHTIDRTVEAKAAAFWEYIRRYMEDGPESVPLPVIERIHTDLSLEELHEEYGHFPLWPEGASFFTKLLNILLLPLSITWYAISYPTELLYWQLARRVKVNPFPPELEEPCRCDEPPLFSLVPGEMVRGAHGRAEPHRSAA